MVGAPKRARRPADHVPLSLELEAKKLNFVRLLVDQPLVDPSNVRHNFRFARLFLLLNLLEEKIKFCIIGYDRNNYF